MANISIRGLSDSIKTALQKRAAAEGGSMEALLRRLLSAAAGENTGAAPGQGGGAAEKRAAAFPQGAIDGISGAQQAAGQLGILRGRRVLLILGGSVAVYKALELIRMMRRAGAQLQAVMTAAAQHFITPMAVAALTGGRVYTELFAFEDGQEISHIRLARAADIVIFAGLSASRMAKMAAGQADDLAGAVLLARRVPALLAPAMNPAMWAHPATQRNYAQLKTDGCLFVGPEHGEMAESDEAGFGRMSEPRSIAAAAAEILRKAHNQDGASGALPGRTQNPASVSAGAKGDAIGKVIITAGPTYEAIDPVRYLANHSSGRQGYALAAALAARGAQVKLISGPSALPAPQGVDVQRVTTALEMQAAVQAALPAAAAIFTAAVADWRPARAAPEKLKKRDMENAAPHLPLVENPDILAGIGHSPQRPQLVVGFAAETADLAKNAAAKLAKKGADWIIANNVAPKPDGISVMGGAHNQIHIFSSAGVESWAEMPKEQVAEKLAERIIAFLRNSEPDKRAMPATDSAAHNNAAAAAD